MSVFLLISLSANLLTAAAPLSTPCAASVPSRQDSIMPKAADPSTDSLTMALVAAYAPIDKRIDSLIKKNGWNLDSVAKARGILLPQLEARLTEAWTARMTRIIATLDGITELKSLIVAGGMTPTTFAWARERTALAFISLVIERGKGAAGIRLLDMPPAADRAFVVAHESEIRKLLGTYMDADTP